MKNQEFISITSPKIKITDQDVHIWYASIGVYANRINNYLKIMSPEEISRAERFQFDQDKNRYIVGRGLLRIILSCYLNISPDGLEFCYNRYGKPDLSAICNNQNLQFNVSHSNNIIIYGITINRDIGIDIEHIQYINDADGIIQRFCSDSEKVQYHRVPENTKQLAFFLCWTRKEAFIKALGDGLTRPLDEFTVSLIPGLPVKLLSVKGGEKEAEKWSLQEITLNKDDYVAAVAVKGRRLRFYTREWC